MAKNTRVRGTVMAVPSVSSPGMLFAKGAQRPFVLPGVWRAPSHPEPGQTVEVGLDELGHVLWVQLLDPAELVETEKGAKKGFSWKRVLAWVVCGFLTLVMGVLAVEWLFTRYTPELALVGAKEALVAHDVTKFDQYVDTASVFDDALDQLAAGVGASASEFGVFGQFLAGGASSWLVDQAKKNVVPGLVSQVDDYVGSGPDSKTHNDTSDGSEGDSQSFSSQIRRALSQAMSEKVKFHGLGTSVVQGDVGRVPIELEGDGAVFTINVRLHWTGDHWQVVSIEHISTLLSKLF